MTSDMKNLDDVVVIESRDRGFVLETRRHEGILPSRRLEHLDRDSSIEPDFPGHVDDGEAAVAELLFDLIAVDPWEADCRIGRRTWCVQHFVRHSVTRAMEKVEADENLPELYSQVFRIIREPGLAVDRCALVLHLEKGEHRGLDSRVSFVRIDWVRIQHSMSAQVDDSCPFIQ